MLFLEPLLIPEDYHTNGVRTRRSDEKDGLALSREIFKNITKKLRENIKLEATDGSDHLLQSEYRFRKPFCMPKSSARQRIFLNKLPEGFIAFETIKMVTYWIKILYAKLRIIRHIRDVF